jgi:hypothetical protein
MRPAITIGSFGLVVLFLCACKRELSCENCAGNQPPIAKAGADQTILLPADSTLLNGSASVDPDGTITSYHWKIVQGPLVPVITSQQEAQTRVKGLLSGVYHFELTVTDNVGLLAKDTIEVRVEDPAQINQPPFACAGVDQVLTLPTNVAALDGSCSSDPDNNITAYQWTKIAGPVSYSLTTAGAVITDVNTLTEGVYQFELKVTDAGGLSSKDTVQVVVNATATTTWCGDSTRTVMNLKLVQVGTLSEARVGMAVASSGNKILFAGGGYYSTYNNQITSRVDIYDIATNRWSTAELSIPRFDIAAVAAGGKIFFAGGDRTDGSLPVNNVDIYDVATNTWSTTALSRADNNLTAAAIGNKVFFAGGSYHSTTLDIFDLTTHSWTKKSLSASKFGTSAATAGNKVYFAGGYCNNQIDIYDNATDTWSVSNLEEAKYYTSGIVVENKIYWAGGVACSDFAMCQVEIRDLNTGRTTTNRLSKQAYFSRNFGQDAVVKDRKIIFYGSANSLEPDKLTIYDVATDTWFTGVLPVRLEAASIIAVNNTVYLAGGLLNDVLSRQVWKLEF